MTDWIDFLPLYTRTEDDIRTDFDADANAGLDPSDPDWIDTRPGNFFHMVTQPFVIEAARIHDNLGTLPAIAFIEFAFGQYLDYHAAELSTERKAATNATGHALFAGTVGTTVTTGTQIGTLQTDPNVAPIIFLTTATATINGPLATPVGLGAVVATSGGHLADGDRFYVVTAYDAAGETLHSAEVDAHIAGGGGNAKVTLSWTAVPNATGYYVYEGATGAEAQAMQVATPSLVDDGTLAWVARALPTANTTGGKVLVPIQAQDAGADGDVDANALTEMVTFNQQIASVTNPQPCTGGFDVENDPDLQVRLLALRFENGPGRPSDYEGWALGYAGVGRVHVIPVWNGAGTVGVVIMDDLGNPLPAATIATVQAGLDPYPGLGGGQAPIDHIVTVMTPAMVPVNVTATITFKTGYSYDGINNTIPLRQTITNAINAYFQSADVGEHILHDRLLTTLYDVEGVQSAVVSAPSGDTVITEVPPQRGELGVLTLN